MADVKADPGAGVGKSGVVTPWETGNLGKGNGDWQTRPRGATSPNDMNENRKNSADTGEVWDRPWEQKCKSPAGPTGSMENVDPKR